jgi:hypothetical protein
MAAAAAAAGSSARRNDGTSSPTLSRVLELGLTGRALLRLEDRTLSDELSVADAFLRARILEAVAQLCADTDGKHVLIVSSSSSSSSSSSQQQQQHESLASAAVSYSRAQLLFLLGEQNRLILQLQDENARLRAKQQQ